MIYSNETMAFDPLHGTWFESHFSLWFWVTVDALLPDIVEPTLIEAPFPPTKMFETGKSLQQHVKRQFRFNAHRHT